MNPIRARPSVRVGYLKSSCLVEGAEELSAGMFLKATSGPQECHAFHHETRKRFVSLVLCTATGTDRNQKSIEIFEPRVLQKLRGRPSLPGINDQCP
jgi:hypothetical protein